MIKAHRLGNFLPSFLQPVHAAVRKRRANLQYAVIIMQNSVDIGDRGPLLDGGDPGRHAGPANNFGND